MNWQYTSLTPLLGIVALTMFGIAIFAWRRRPALGAAPLSISMFFVGIWTLGYGVQLAAINMQTNVFWGQVKYIGIIFLPLAWFYLALEYNGPRRLLTNPSLILLAIIPVTTLFLTWTNQFHGLIWSRVWFDTSGPVILRYHEHGVGLWVFAIYASLLIIASTMLYINSFIRARPAYRMQIGIMVICTLIPWGGIILHLARLTPIYPIEPTPFVFAVAGLMATWGLLRWQLLDLMPVQHKAILEGIEEGILVLDEKHRILEANNAAQQIFNKPVSDMIGKAIDQIWPDQDFPCDCLTAEADGCKEVTLTTDKGERIFLVRPSAFSDKRGRLLNKVVVFQDITNLQRTAEVLNQTQSDLEARNRQIDEINYQLQQELNVRRETEESLRILNQELESRVIQRTAELTAMNADLVREVEQHELTEKELLQRNRELVSLQAAAAATATSLDIPFVLDTVTWEMVNLLGVEGCSILEWNQPEDTLKVIADYAEPVMFEQEDRNHIYALGEHPQRGQVLNDQYSWQMVVSQTDLDFSELAYMERAGLKSLLILPMVFQDKVVGLVEIKDSEVERTFTDHEISLVQLLANQAASAIENARLYQRSQLEIEERMRAEERIKTSLKEKEVMLKEIHHRVKNNLQVITSLLRLQSQSIQDEEALDLFKESQNRIRSMALIHEKLYRSADLARIDFGDYIRNLTTYLVRSYRRGMGPVALNINAQDVALSIETAVPCGLIINELVSNSLKHAFPTDANGHRSRQNGQRDEISIDLTLAPHNQVTLAVKDNGVGIPDDVDYENTDSLGMQLVTTLTEQLDGTVKLNCDAGTEFRIEFSVIQK